MKKTALMLLLVMLIVLTGCTSFVLDTAEALGVTDEEPIHMRISEPIPEPEFETCAPVDEAYIDEIFELTNSEREAGDLPKLELSPTLCSIAMLRAVDMAENNYFDHVSPTGESAFNLLKEYKVLLFNSAENIGQGDVACEKMVEAWMNSPEHCEIIMSETYHQLGVGIAKAADGEVYWVQVFIN